MAYEQLEEIRSRKREKVALFLTAENMGGLLLATLPVYIATAQFQSFFLRVVLLALAATCGVVVTLEYGGLALYERAIWRIRGFMRVKTAGALLTPDQFSPRPVRGEVQILPVDGSVMPLPAQPVATWRNRPVTQAVAVTPADATTAALSPFDEVLQRDAARSVATSLPPTRSFEDTAHVHV